MCTDLGHGSDYELPAGKIPIILVTIRSHFSKKVQLTLLICSFLMLHIYITFIHSGKEILSNKPRTLSPSFSP